MKCLLYVRYFLTIRYYNLDKYFMTQDVIHTVTDTWNPVEDRMFESFVQGHSQSQLVMDLVLNARYI